MRSRQVIDCRRCHDSQLLRKRVTIPGLWELRESQVSIVLAGLNGWRWTAIALVDSVSPETCPSALKSGLFGRSVRRTGQGIDHVNRHLYDPVLYFLRVWEERMKPITRNWEEIVTMASQALGRQVHMCLFILFACLFPFC